MMPQIIVILIFHLNNYKVNKKNSSVRSFPKHFQILPCLPSDLRFRNNEVHLLHAFFDISDDLYKMWVSVWKPIAKNFSS